MSPTTSTALTLDLRRDGHRRPQSSPDQRRLKSGPTYSAGDQRGRRLTTAPCGTRVSILMNWVFAVSTWASLSTDW